MVRGAWWATVHGAAKESDTTEQLNNDHNKQAQSLNSQRIKLKSYIALYVERRIVCLFYRYFLSAYRVPGTVIMLRI